MSHLQHKLLFEEGYQIMDKFYKNFDQMKTVKILIHFFHKEFEFINCDILLKQIFAEKDLKSKSIEDLKNYIFHIIQTSLINIFKDKNKMQYFKIKFIDQISNEYKKNKIQEDIEMQLYRRLPYYFYACLPHHIKFKKFFYLN